MERTEDTSTLFEGLTVDMIRMYVWRFDCRYDKNVSFVLLCRCWLLYSNIRGKQRNWPFTYEKRRLKKQKRHVFTPVTGLFRKTELLKSKIRHNLTFFKQKGHFQRKMAVFREKGIFSRNKKPIEKQKRQKNHPCKKAFLRETDTFLI